MIFLPEICNDRLGTRTWLTATAAKVTEEVVEFEYTQGTEKKREWIEAESDRLAPAGSMVHNERWHAAAELEPYLIDSQDDGKKKN